MGGTDHTRRIYCSERNREAIKILEELEREHVNVSDFTCKAIIHYRKYRLSSKLDDFVEMERRRIERNQILEDTILMLTRHSINQLDDLYELNDLRRLYSSYMDAATKISEVIKRKLERDQNPSLLRLT